MLSSAPAGGDDCGGISSVGADSGGVVGAAVDAVYYVILYCVIYY